MMRITLSETISLSLVTLDDLKPLVKTQGYLLLNLDVSGVAPSLEVSRIDNDEELFISAGKKIKTTGKSIIIKLKDKINGFYFVNIPAGLYQITQINAPYFDLPFKLDTKNAREWRFSIKQGHVNYAGKLFIDKNRSTSHVDISLFNRIATDKNIIEKSFHELLTMSPLRSGAGVRDDYLDYLTIGDGV